MRKTIWPHVLAACILLQSGTATNLPVSGAFKGCPVAGTDGDITLNSLKNRSAEAGDPHSNSVSQIVNLPDPGVTNRLPRDQWTQQERDLVATIENRRVVVAGFLVGFKKEDRERCNCRKPDLNDFHLWLAPRGDFSKAEAIVVEITPRWRGANPSWAQETLSHLKTQRAKIRVTGWLLYDQEHLNEIGNSRAAAWEIHPITKIEVFSGGEWQEL